MTHLSDEEAHLIVPLIKQIVPDDDPCPVLELGDSDAPYSEPLLPGLCLLFAFDQPDQFAFLQSRHLSSLGLQPEDVRPLALENLRRRLPKIERHGSAPAFMLTVGGNLEAALLLLDDLWESQRELVEGDVVAAVPARDVLLFTGSRSLEGIEAVRASVERVWNNPSSDHLLSKDLFVFRAGAWEPLEWSAG